MLCEITIENVAVIEKATAVFENGFTVLTGETGAGKSILIDSINAILGNRVSREIVRNGASKAKIWASFSSINKAVEEQLEEAGYSVEDELLLYREISAEGKSVCRINGAPATASVLRDVCAGLINIHGQNDNQSLLNPSKHLGVLDAFAHNDDLLAAYRNKYRKLTGIQKEMRNLSMDEEEKNRKLDLLRYEVEEIELAELADGEEEELTEQRDVIVHAQSILQALNNAYYLLSGGDEEGGAATLLSEAASEIQEASRYAQDLTPYAETLQEIYYTSTEIASELQNKLTHFEFEGHSLDEIEQRLDLLYRLRQKYGTTIESVIAYGEKAREELEAIEFSAERIEKLAAEESILLKQVNELADALTQARKDAFERFNGQISKALEFLNMPGIVFALQHKSVNFGPNGQDELEFYIATNAGETPKPLAKIASGGELSRIMLALKSALADKDDIGTVIYDEVDTGVSGLAAGRIGKMLRYTAKGRQVICVTHTAQVAAFASQHLLIEKKVNDGRTFTQIRELDHKNRIRELARVISGDRITDISLANAEEMLSIAANSKNK